MSESITKPNTIETFMKANTDLRIGADTIKEFQTQIDVIATSITKESEKQARAAGRSTIMPVDIKSALSNISGSAADLPTLFKQLEKLNAKDTANISAMIQTWLNTH